MHLFHLQLWGVIIFLLQLLEGEEGKKNTRKLKSGWTSPLVALVPLGVNVTVDMVSLLVFIYTRFPQSSTKPLFYFILSAPWCLVDVHFVSF